MHLRSTVFGLCLVLVTSGFTRRCRAELLLEPVLGTVILSDQAGDEVVAQISSFNGRFYGAPVGPLQISDNGKLIVSGNPGLFPRSLDPSANSSLALFAGIAPLWDDFVLLPGAPNSVIDHSSRGEYLAITWNQMHLFNELPSGSAPLPTSRSFQLLWFESDTLIRGTSFLADDIVFSYVAHDPLTGDFGPLQASVGITDAVSRFSGLPGTIGGELVASQSTLLPLGPGQFVLFRPSLDAGGQVQYTAEQRSLTAVPEPSSWTLLLSMLGWWGWRLRQRAQVWS